MTIEVTGCHDCPFAEMDFDQTSRHWCEHFGNRGDIFDVETHVYWSTIHPSCPLKQETITIKLKENDTTGVCKEGE